MLIKPNKRIYALAAVAAVVLLAVFAWWMLVKPQLPRDGQLAISCVEHPVIVRFDDRGVPYIDAQTESDLYAAQGYLTASERFFQMDMWRRSALGQLAEIYGATAVADDQLMRTLDLHDLAEVEMGQLSGPARAMLDAYARGVNAYLERNQAGLPLEFTLLGYHPRPWRSQDTIAVIKYHAYLLDESWRLDQLRQLVKDKVGDKFAAELFHPNYSRSVGRPSQAEAPPAREPQKADKVGVTTDAFGKALAQLHSNLNEFGRRAHTITNPDPTWGSTAMVVPPALSKSGGALLACDKHTQLSNPSLWYMCSLSGPAFHVAGATIPGVPGVVSGRNENIAWASANLKADVQDLFIEQFDSPMGTKYRTSSGWEEAQVQTELIPVRFNKDIQFKVYKTSDGPILMRNEAAAVALSWTGYNTRQPTLNSIYLLNRAASWEDFIGAIGQLADPPQMFVYADRFGNTGCHGSGLIPIREDGADGTTLLEGWHKKGRWKSFIDFHSLPNQAYAYDANVSAPLIAANQGFSGSSLPKLNAGVEIGSQFDAPYRANRAFELLNREPHSMSLTGLNSIQSDQFAQLSHLIKTELSKAIINQQLIARTQLLSAKALALWDNQQKGSSSVASIYQSYLRTLARRLLEPKLGKTLTDQYLTNWPLSVTFVQNFLVNKPSQWLPPEERTHETFLLTTLTQALKTLNVSFSGDTIQRWTWQTLHTAFFRQIGANHSPLLSWFDLGPTGVGGDATSLFCCDVSASSPPTAFPAGTAATGHLLIDMADAERFYQSAPPGQSGQRCSANHADQVESWVRGQPHELFFASAQIDKNAKHRLVLIADR